MGQKVNPIGYRLGVNKTWDSRWYANKKDFGTTLNKDLKIRKYLEEHLKDAAVASGVPQRLLHSGSRPRSGEFLLSL